MESIYTYTTPSFTISFKESNVLTNYRKIVVSLKQDGITEIDKFEDDLEIDLEQDTITVEFTQEETGKLFGGKPDDPNYARIQVNIYYEDEDRNSTSTETIEVYSNLYEDVIGNE